MPELFANQYATTLAADVTDSASAIEVPLAAPAALQGGSFRVLVNHEYMMVTSGQDTGIWLVTRGIEGSTAVAHAAGSVVEHVATAGSVGGRTDPAADVPGLRSLTALDARYGTTLDTVPGAVADVSLHGHKLTNVGDPTTGTDALNRETGDVRYDPLNAASTEAARALAAEALLAPLANPALTGNPTAPTQSAGNNSTRLGTTAYADRAVSDHVAASDPHGDRAFASNALASALAGLAPAEFPAATQGSALTHSGIGQTIGGVVVTAGMRILDTANSTSAGLWVAASGAWTRPVDFAVGSNAQGKLVEVDGGGLWLCVSTSTVTVGTDPQTWTEIDASVIQAGTGLSKSGNTLSLALTKALVTATGLAAADVGADAAGVAATQAAAAQSAAEAASVLRDGTGMPASVESVPSGAVSSIFQPHAYNILADTVVDAEGNYVSGTDDTLLWMTLIAALPADTAVIRLHGISLISNVHALTYILGFATSRLAIIGDGPHSGFYMADNSNAAPLRFNTTGLSVGPPLLDRLHLERFAVYGNGYNQSDPGGGSGVLGIDIYCYRTVRVKNVQTYQCRNVAVNIAAFTDAKVDDLLVDTVIAGSAANGLNFNDGGSVGWMAHRARVINSTFIDVPNQPIYSAGRNVGEVEQAHNHVGYRNLRPRPTTLGSWTQEWQNATQAATAWSSGTDYVPSGVAYTVVSNGGFNYLCVQSSGPGHSGAVTPGTDQRYWWLQNKPLQWSAGTSYALGQCCWYTTPTNPASESAYSAGTNYAIGAAVSANGIPYIAATASGPGNGGAVTPGTNSAVWFPSVSLPGGWRVNFTAVVASTNVAPVSANGTLRPQWFPGGPQFGMGADGFALEALASQPNQEISIVDNKAYGRNWGNELVGENGIYAAYSGAAGIAQKSLRIVGNQIRGYKTGAVVTGDQGTVIEGNEMADCQAGVARGDTSAYINRQLVIAKNLIRLAGLGGGTGVSVAKTGLGGALYGLGVEGNEIDGGSFTCQLTAAILTASNPYTAIPVTATIEPLYPGQPIWIGGPYALFANAAVAIVSAYTPPGSTSIPVNSISFGGNINNATPIYTNTVATLTTALTSGVPVTSLAVSALPFAVQPGQVLHIQDIAGAFGPLAVTVSAVAPFGLGARLQDASIPIASVTPGHTYGIGSVVTVSGGVGMVLNGGLWYFSVKGNHIRATGADALELFASTNAPNGGEMVDNWCDVSGGQSLNVGAVGTTIPIRIEGGGFRNAKGGLPTLPTSGVQVRKVYGITPARDVATPAVPATTAAATMPIYDGILAVTAGAGGATTIGLGTTTQGSAQDTATINVPASQTVLIPVLAGQKVYATYGTNAPTWQYFAQ